MFGFLKKKSVDPRASLNKVLGGYALPSFSAVVLNVMREIRGEDASASSVARILQGDPGISVRLLKIVNSAAFGSARPTESVQQAVAMLGLSQVESLVLSIGVQTALPSSPAPGFETTRFWRAAARRAAAAQRFASMLHPATRSQSFTASLLQDMAVPMLADSRRESYGELLDAWHRGGESLDALEQSELGCHHGEVATWLCSEWDLPENMAEAIGGHHGDPALICPPAVRIVGHLREEDAHLGIDELTCVAEEEFGVSPDRSQLVLAEAFEHADELAKLFG